MRSNNLLLMLNSGPNLRRRAFELQDLQLWAARNSHRLVRVHDCHYYLNQLENLTRVDWRYYHSETEFLQSTRETWEDHKRIVRAAFQ